MRSPFTALTWEIWRRKRKSFWLIIAIITFASLFNSVLPPNIRPTPRDLERLNAPLAVVSLFLAFGIFNYTEFSRQKEWTGFPYRLFTLPVSSLMLVALPMFLGVAMVELIYLAWVKLIFANDGVFMHRWIAVLIGAYLVFYQTILWCLAGFRMLRIITLGLVGTSFIGIALLPLFAEYVSSPWLSEKNLSALVAALATGAFFTSWICVARQRRGGGRRRNLLKVLIERIVDVLPRRYGCFRSPMAAQFWFEWRRAGLLLPLSTAAILVLVISPIAWFSRHNGESTLWILAWTLAMPMILAAPIGKGFSKVDFWSGNLSLPAFQAVRPLATGEMVVIKMKVAALSTGIAWLLVLAFLLVWRILGANLASLSMLRVGFWMAYDHSMWPQYVIAVLFISAGMLVTWKFLAGGLWIGLSGSTKFFGLSATIYCVAALLGLISILILHSHEEIRELVLADPNRLLSQIEWLAASALIGKFWLAAFSWRRIAAQRVRKYLLAWLGGTVCLIALAILLWAHGLLLLASPDLATLDTYRVRNLLILFALLAIPFARLGLAPASLARNRHG